MNILIDLDELTVDYGFEFVLSAKLLLFKLILIACDLDDALICWILNIDIIKLTRDKLFFSVASDDWFMNETNDSCTQVADWFEFYLARGLDN